MSNLLLGHGKYHSHYVVMKPDPRFPHGQEYMYPACGHTVADFEVDDAGTATCRSCLRAERSPRVNPTLLRCR